MDTINASFCKHLPHLRRIFTKRWGALEAGQEKTSEAVAHAFEFYRQEVHANRTPPSRGFLAHHATCRVNGYRRFADRRCDWTNLGTEACSVVKGRRCTPMFFEQADIYEAFDPVVRKRLDPDPYKAAVINVDFGNFMQALPDKHRCVVCLSLKGYEPTEVAELLRVSAARVSQIRTEIQHALAAYWGVKRTPSKRGRKKAPPNTACSG